MNAALGQTEHGAATESTATAGHEGDAGRGTHIYGSLGTTVVGHPYYQRCKGVLADIDGSIGGGTRSGWSAQSVMYQEPAMDLESGPGNRTIHA